MQVRRLADFEAPAGSADTAFASLWGRQQRHLRQRRRPFASPTLEGRRHRSSSSPMDRTAAASAIGRSSRSRSGRPQRRCGAGVVRAERSASPFALARAASMTVGRMRSAARKPAAWSWPRPPERVSRRRSGVCWRSSARARVVFHATGADRSGAHDRRPREA